jgi:hypothetical protein
MFGEVFEIVGMITANLKQRKRGRLPGRLETPAKTVGYLEILEDGEACNSSTVGMYRRRIKSIELYILKMR